MLDIVKMDVTRILMSVRIQTEEEVREAALAIEERAEHIGNVTYTHPNDDGGVSEDRSDQAAQAEQAALGAVAAAMASSWASAVPKVGRNDPCPCGSGQKYSTATEGWPDGEVALSGGRLRISRQQLLCARQGRRDFEWKRGADRCGHPFGFFEVSIRTLLVSCQEIRFGALAKKDRQIAVVCAAPELLLALIDQPPAF